MSLESEGGSHMSPGTSSRLGPVGRECESHHRASAPPPPRRRQTGADRPPAEPAPPGAPPASGPSSRRGPGVRRAAAGSAVLLQAVHPSGPGRGVGSLGRWRLGMADGRREAAGPPPVRGW